MIHDFISLNNTIIFLDSPMIIDLLKFNESSIPLQFKKKW